MKSIFRIVIAISFAVAAIVFALFIFGRKSFYTCKNCNVIVIAFDALQPSHVGAYGYPRKTTPNLDEFAKDAFLFTNAISPAPWTVPTYISWWTSLFPSEHKVVNRFSVFEPPKTEIANLRKLTPSAVTLAEVMKKSGYVTVGFTGDAGARAAQGNNIGFDIYIDEPPGFNGFDLSVPMALEWLKNNRDKKFFMFLHGYDSHGQYKPKEFARKFLDFDYQGKFTGTVQEQAALREEGLAKGVVAVSDDDVRFWRAWYDEKINAADARFGHFWNEFKKLGLPDKTIVIIASDHGTEFYEHKRFDHGHTLYQELIRVPLLVRTPKIRGGKTVTSLVSTLDIMPTVLDLTGIQPETEVISQIKGRTLVPALFGRNVGRDVFSETDYRLFTHKRAALTPDGWKFILTLVEAPDKKNVKELYNLKTDPGETRNLADAEPRIAYELEQKVLKHMEDVAEDVRGPWVVGCSPVYNEQCREPAAGK